MNSLEARDAVNKVMLDAWIAAGYDPVNVRWSLVPGDMPTEEVVWAKAAPQHYDGGQQTFGGHGNRVFNNEGTYWVQVFAPVGGGGEAVHTAATAILKALRDSKNISVWFRNAKMKEVGISGAFDQINVLADFTYDTLG